MVGTHFVTSSYPIQRPVAGEGKWGVWGYHGASRWVVVGVWKVRKTHCWMIPRDGSSQGESFEKKGILVTQRSVGPQNERIMSV